MKKLITLFVVLCFAVTSYGQVFAISYSVDFDYAVGDTSFYDCNIHIDEGSATTFQDRAQFNAQYTIVTPAGGSLEIVENYMPLINNLFGGSTIPMEWSISTFTSSPSAAPGNSFYAIAPDLFPPLVAYNNLNTGDVVKIFRIAVVGENLCPFDIRAYEEDWDPSSSEFNGQDFRNGFNIGSTEQLYVGNIFSNDYAEDIDITLDDAASCTGELATLAPNLNCVPAFGFDLSYLWSTGETTESISVYTDTEEEYSLTISGPIGYTQELTATVINPSYALDNGGNHEFCVGHVIDLGLGSGTLTSSNVSVMYGDQDGIVHAISPGVVTMLYTDDVNGCTAEIQYTVLNLPIANMSPNDTICIGETTQLSSDGVGGTWVSSDTDVATISNSVLATGIGAGWTNFIFTDFNGCNSIPTEPLLVYPSTSVELDLDQLCLGQTTIATSSAFGGAWVSDDTTVAIIDVFTGQITPISGGCVTFSFTDAATGCTVHTNPLCVTTDIEVDFLGSDEICPGGTTQLSPSTGGLWTSADPAIATVDNSGLVTGIDYGSTIFTFQDTINFCADGTTSAIIVGVIQGLAIVGSDEICLGTTTQLSPKMGGEWISEDESIATNDLAGEVTGVGAGSTVFNFNSNLVNCQIVGGDLEISVNEVPTIELTGEPSICVGGTTTVSTNGTLQQIGNNITFTNGGVITGVIPGVGKIYAINDDGCSSDTIDITVNALPVASFIGPDFLCGGMNTTVSPNTGGTWITDNPIVATVDNSGFVTPLSPGITYLYYTSSVTGCISEGIKLTVGNAIPASIDESIICVGETTQANASIEGEGNWSSSDNDVAGIDNNGLVTGIGEGTVELIFTSSSNSCQSVPVQLTVLPLPTITLDAIELEICLGESTTIIATGGDSYNWSNGIGPGDSHEVSPTSTTTIEVTGTDANGCENTAEVRITVNPLPTIITDVTEICQSESLEVQIINGSTIIVEGPSGFSDAIVTDLGDGNFSIDFNAIGIFTITPIDDFSTGCEVDITLINVVASPIIEPASSPTIFVGDTLQIFSPDMIVELFTANSLIAIPNTTLSIVGLSAGQTQVIAMGFNGCLSDSLTVTVLSNDLCSGIDATGDPVIIGTAFIDTNENGIRDQGEDPLRNVLVTTDPGNFSILTDDNGQYQLNLQVGMYSLVAQVNEGIWLSDQLSIEIDVLDPCSSGYDFGFVPISTPLPMANLSMTNTIARCDWETRFDITVENTGTEILEGELQFTFDDRATLFSSDFPDIQVNGNVVSGQIDPLDPFAMKKYRVTVKMPGGSSNLPMLDFETKLVAQSGLTIAEYGYSDQLRCSYDPNDKREYPDREGEENLTLMDEDIEYTIRFQNNGNDTAFQVRIVDPLDPSIDPSTIRVVGSSHDVETCIDGPDLIFLFEDIFLVDSMTNYDASQGYVTFKCNTKEGRGEMTPVHNQADIIFDTNPPIVTNTTLNTLVTELCTDKAILVEMSICDGEEYEGYNESGTYTAFFELPYGCDSVVTLILEVKGITFSQQNLTVCEGESVLINNVLYTIEESTTLKDTIYDFDGCISNIQTYEIELIPGLIDGFDNVNFCLGTTTSITIPFAGIWTTDDESIIAIDEDGNIIAVGVGSAMLGFIGDESGCTDQVNVIVNDVPSITNTGADQICINNTTTLISDIEGFWLSDNNAVISVDNLGLVTGIEPGVANVMLTNFATGCTNSISIEVLETSAAGCTVSTIDLTENSIYLHPNPASESIFIESEIIWNSISILDTRGRVLKKITDPKMGETQVDVSEYNSGVYLIVFENDKTVATKRFVKQ